MKFKVEIEDFYLDREEDIEPSLKQFVINSVVQTINKQIEKRIEDTINLQVKQLIEKHLTLQIQKQVLDFVINGKVKGRYTSNKEISIEQYIKEDFEHNSGYSSPHEKIAELAKTFGDELKRRYDLLFASQIVAKLNTNGLLKEDVAKMLIETIESKK